MSDTTARPRFLYGHGFASGPSSAKGVALRDHFAARGADLALLDLRRPSLERLRLTAILSAIEAAIGGPRDRAVLLGSSLGGLAACRVAERDPRVCALVLLAPAFRLADRWRLRLGDHDFRRWRDTGWLAIDDHATRAPARVDFGFYDDLAAADAPGELPDVRVPTLIVHGTADDVVPVAGSRRFAAGKPHVRLVEVDDGHELVASLPTIIGEVDRHLATFF